MLKVGIRIPTGIHDGNVNKFTYVGSARNFKNKFNYFIHKAIDETGESLYTGRCGKIDPAVRRCLWRDLIRGKEYAHAYKQ